MVAVVGSSNARWWWDCSVCTDAIERPSRRCEIGDLAIGRNGDAVHPPCRVLRHQRAHATAVDADAPYAPARGISDEQRGPGNDGDVVQLASLRHVDRAQQTASVEVVDLDRVAQALASRGSERAGGNGIQPARRGIDGKPENGIQRVAGLRETMHPAARIDAMDRIAGNAADEERRRSRIEGDAFGDQPAIGQRERNAAVGLHRKPSLEARAQHREARVVLDSGEPVARWQEARALRERLFERVERAFDVALAGTEHG